MKTRLTGHHPYISPNNGEQESPDIEWGIFWIEYCKTDDDYIVIVERVEAPLDNPFEYLSAQHGFNLLDYWKA